MICPARGTVASTYQQCTGARDHDEQKKKKTEQLSSGTLADGCLKPSSTCTRGLIRRIWRIVHRQPAQDALGMVDEWTLWTHRFGERAHRSTSPRRSHASSSPTGSRCQPSPRALRCSSSCRTPGSGLSFSSPWSSPPPRFPPPPSPLTCLSHSGARPSVAFSGL